ncbi:MAG: Cof-type HAD-IIB family hydrolase [Propionibacteriaceae bacterium]|nr:Cof-type HAD-IIB family hydrolase [Propionibacteriaceae bacterium]
MVAVIAVDMDGTFLRPDDTYDRARFERLLAVMRERGIRFVVASGNQLTQLRSFFQPFDDAAFVAENGHIVVDQGQTTPLATAVLDPEAAQRVIRSLTALGHPFVMSGTEGAFVPATAPEWFVDGMRRYYHRLDVAEDLLALDVDVMKFSMITDTDVVEVARQVSEEVGDVLNVVISGPRDMDMNQPGIHKAHGLGLLLDRWGVDWKDVVSFGDGGNDVELLAASGRGYALEGARDSLVEVATHRAGSNANDAVLDVIEELLS